MKYLSLSFIAAALIFLMSANSAYSSGDSHPRTPSFSLENTQGARVSSNTEGRYILLHFWDTTDARSRLDNFRYSSRAAGEYSSQLIYAGVYTGSDRTLFEAALQADGCDASQQFFLDDNADAANLRADFSIATGHHTFLLSPDGHIIAVNPDAETIATLIHS